MDQLQIDTKLRMMYPNALPGQKFTFACAEFTYKGTDLLYDQMDMMSRGEFRDIYDIQAAQLMLRDPLGYQKGPFQLDASINALLTGDIDGFLAGAAGIAAYNAIAGISDPFCGKKYKTEDQIKSAVKNALIGAAAGAVTGGALGGAAGKLGGMAANALGGIASNFLPPGLDAPVQAVKGAIGNVTKQLPFKTSGAADIASSVSKIVAVKTLLESTVKGPTSAIFKAVSSNMGMPSLAAAASGISLQSQVAGLAGLASNPVAFAAQAASIHSKFPMVNVNKLASKMIAGSISGALGGKGFNMASMVPNMNLSPGGLMKMLPIPGMTPVSDALNPFKTAKAPKPKPPVQPKNLFAEGAAGAAMATLKQPLSQFMGMKATIAPQTDLVASTPAKTSYNQKLVGNANTVNWGSGGYARENRYANLEKKRMELSSKIEQHTAELLNSVDYSKLTKYSYPDLIKKHPRIKTTSTVIEALSIIEEDEAAAAAKANTAISSA
jgi:hypothetical protein